MFVDLPMLSRLRSSDAAVESTGSTTDTAAAVKEEGGGANSESLNISLDWNNIKSQCPSVDTNVALHVIMLCLYILSLVHNMTVLVSFASYCVGHRLSRTFFYSSVATRAYSATFRGT